jgi:hypothetical protein
MNVSTKYTIDGLLDRALNEELSPIEAEELSRLADEDEQAAKQVRMTLLIEAALRARGQVPDVASQIVSTLSQRDLRQREQVVSGVMSQVRTRPPSAKIAAKPKRPRLVILSAVTAVAIGFAAMAALVSRQPRTHVRSTQPAEHMPRSPQIEMGQSFQTPLAPVEVAKQTSVVVADPIANGVDRDILNFDFEDGVLPAVFEQGHVIHAPPTATSVYVVQGTFNAWAPGVSSVLVNNRQGLFTYHGAIVLRFKYFLATEANGLRVQIFDVDQRQNYQWNHPNPARGEWASVSVSLATFYPVKDRSRALESGDRLQNINIMGGPIHTAPLLIDDIALGPDR